MKIRFLSSMSGDWVGMYINGELKIEGHSLHPLDIVELILNNLNIQYEAKLVEDIYELLDYSGRCPEIFPEDYEEV